MYETVIIRLFYQLRFNDTILKPSTVALDSPEYPLAKRCTLSLLTMRNYPKILRQTRRVDQKYVSPGTDKARSDAGGSHVALNEETCRLNGYDVRAHNVWTKHMDPVTQ